MATKKPRRVRARLEVRTRRSKTSETSRSPRITDVAVQLYKSIFHKHAGYEGTPRGGAWFALWLPTPVPPEYPRESVAGVAAFHHRGGLFESRAIHPRETRTGNFTLRRSEVSSEP